MSYCTNSITGKLFKCTTYTYIIYSQVLPVSIYIYIHIFISVYVHTLIVHTYLMEFHGLSQIFPLKCRVSLVSYALSMGQCCSGAGNVVESRDTAPWSVWSMSLFLSILVPFEMKGV